MSVFVANAWRIILMLALLACSAFFSGSETAFFNLSRREVRAFGKSTNKLQNLTAWLLGRPQRLLSSVLFGNMLVNVLFFSLAAVLSVDIGRGISPLAGAFTAVAAFFAVLLCGEMLPKSVAYSNSRGFCIIAAPVCCLCVRVLSPVLRIFEGIVVMPAVRLLVGPVVNEPVGGGGADQLKTLLGASRHQGLISHYENQLLTEVLEFGLLKARHIMQPRVDMALCGIDETVRRAGQVMAEHKLARLPIYDGQIDNIVGMLAGRDVLLGPDKTIRTLLGPTNFVPEQKSVESLLEFFYRTDNDSAIVVDEYGGVTGVVSLDHVIDELFGVHTELERESPIEQIGPMKYRISGNLPIHDWAEFFGMDPGQVRVATVGGLVVTLLGRIPRLGDVAVFGDMRLEVEQVSKHRIVSLLVWLEPAADGG